MKYKNLLLTLTAFLLLVFYALFKRAPTIQNSLIRDGYKLVSNSNKKEEIYTNILKRNDKDINLIVLDNYLVGENRKWEALSFWCDLEISKNSFLRSTQYQIRFCVMAIEDWAKSEKSMRDKKFFELNEFQKQNFLEKVIKIKKEELQSLTEKEKSDEFINSKWEEYCSQSNTKPYRKLDNSLIETVLEYCYT